MSYLLQVLAGGLEAGLGETLERHLPLGRGKPMCHWEAVVRDHPDWPDARLNLGLAHLRGLQLAEAVEHLSEACRLKPDYLAARLALASAYDESGRSSDALGQLQCANQTHPGDPHVLFATGYCLEKLTRSSEAAALYRDVLKGCRGFIPALRRLAAIALLQDNAAEAVACYQQLKALCPEDIDVLVTLAHLYGRNRQPERAVECFEAAIALEPDNWALVDDEVETLVQAGQAPQAVERLYQLLQEQGPFPDLHLRLGELLSEMGQDEEAGKHYRLALDGDPNYLEAMVKLGTHHLAQGKWDQSAEAFHRAAELNDRLLTCYVGLGVAQQAQGETAQAIETFHLAGAVEGNSTVLLAEMARMQLKAALAEEFERHVDAEHSLPVVEADLDHDDLLQVQVERHGQEVQRHPEYADTRFRYGVLLRAEGRLGEALEQFQAAADINPTYVAALIRLGITQQDLGQGEAAIATFGRILELKPGYVDVHYRLAVLHTDRRQFEQAVRHMEAARNLAPGNPQFRAGLALALQNMGLMDRVAATWRSLAQMGKAAAGEPRAN